MSLHGAIKARDALLDIINANNLNNFGIEVGVQEGKFSKKILNQWSGRKLYMVDAWRNFDNYNDIANVADEVHAIKMLTALENTQEHKDRRCVLCETSIEAANMFPDHYFDWIYLDAAHDKESVLRDLRAWMPKLKLGGIMCGDDYLEGTHFNTEFGVISALNEFKAEYSVSTKLDIKEITAPNEISQWWFKA